jgi:tetratricopeptide (TPR) repeat protein
MNKSAIFVLLLISGLSMSGTCASRASDVSRSPPNSQSGVSLYANGKFEEAKSQFQAEIRVNPINAVAHYYLALCYQHLKQRDDAAKEYELAIQYSSDKQLTTYAQSGLAACRAAVPTLVGASANVTGSTRDPIGEQKNSIMQTAQKQMAEVDERREAKIRKIREDCLDQMNSVPRFFYSPGRYTYRMANANYDVAVQTIQLEANQNIEKETAAAERDKQSILAGANERIAALESTMAARSIQSSSRGKTTPSTPDSSAQHIASTVDAQSSVEAQKILAQAEKRVAEIDERTNATVAPVQADANERIAQIPKTIQIAVGRYGRTMTIINPDYENLVGPIEQETSEKIGRIRDAAEREKKDVLYEAHRRADSMNSVASGMRSQLARPGNSIQLVPLGSSLYGRQYMNFGDESSDSGTQKLQPLSAKAKKLEDSTDRTGQDSGSKR